MPSANDDPETSTAPPPPPPGDLTLLGTLLGAMADFGVDLSALPDEERLLRAASSAEKAVQAHSKAEELKTTAATLSDPAARARVLQEAYEKEVEAHGQSKVAKRLQSGTLQGAIGGAGIGGAVGVGLGTVVGTLVGGVLTIPTTAVGGLVGSGVGAIHGPFFKLGEGTTVKQGGGDAERVAAAPGESQSPAEPLTVPDPKDLKRAAADLKRQKEVEAQKPPIEKKMNPRRPLPPRQDGRERKRPKKLQVR